MSDTPHRCGRLIDRLRQARDSAFVGRTVETAAFRSMLDRRADRDGFVVLYLHGPGGAGKSALLRRFAAEAEAAGRTVVSVDARTVERSPAGFAAAASGAHHERRVLLLDTFEAYQGLENWFWESFLPELPADALVVIAGRQPPDPRHRVDPVWSAAVRVLAVDGLAPGDAAALLRSRGVPERLHQPLHALTGGHPLALVLAAEVAARDPRGAERWLPHDGVIKVLLDRLVGKLPSAEHLRALEICAHVFATREDLLRTVFGERGGELFAWLRGQPFIEAGPHGLRPHDLVRDLLGADLRWRDPAGWEAMHRQVRPYFIERALGAVGDQVIPAQMALSYLHRHGPVLAKFLTWREHGEVYEDSYRPADRDVVLKLAEQSQGAAHARLVAFWLDRQPEGFGVYRRPGGGTVAAFVAWLRLTAPDEEENEADGLVAALWSHARQAGPPRPGRKLAVQRFLAVDGGPPGPSQVVDLIYLRGVATCMREPDLAWTFLVTPDPDFWAPALEHSGHARLTGELAAVFAHDWWATPVRAWLDLQHGDPQHGDPQHGDLLPGAPAPRRPAPLTRDEFGVAVRDLLRNWRHQSSVEHNPLSSTRLGGPGEPADRADRLRNAVEQAVDALRAGPRLEKLHRVLAVTFFHGAPTQEAAAERIGIPFGTYRHRLAAGMDLVIDDLWRREMEPGCR
ncbi:hypothetical protein DMB66_04345 [Actinoplanes sp. ATCC 53533]|uniref:ATP-binding protein n=1 Tax=Actinoplanes sp. ATCC 53533 TaxID=1288362 RepID=UPI000F7B67FC|nr:ATP-binding protein [Actinoplanes sp. ATCC 53533]RSM73253.1 hypothetical protein DMB66_04345 [Actinoplanes sp. ATCC 53533]